MPEGAIRTKESAISITGVAKSYRSGLRTLDVLKSLDLALPARVFAAIVGRSGSGKSTLLNILAGLEPPDSGQVKVAGTDISGASPETLSNYRLRKIGIVFQFFNLLPTLSLEENVALPQLLLGRSRAEARRRARECLQRVDLVDRREFLPHEASGGEIQRAAIARALVNNPTVILADEPTGNLDLVNARVVFEIFRRLVDEEGLTVVLVTHDRDLAAETDITFELSDGRVTRHAAPPSA